MKIRSVFGFFVRKMIWFDEIKFVRILEGWMSCSGMIYYIYLGKVCVFIERIKGWSILFIINRFEELVEVFRILGVLVVGGFF